LVEKLARGNVRTSFRRPEARNHPSPCSAFLSSIEGVDRLLRMRMQFDLNSEMGTDLLPPVSEVDPMPCRIQGKIVIH